MAASRVEISSSQRRINILLVDDQEDYRILLRDEIEIRLPGTSLIHESRLSIHDAASGEEALRFVVENPVDIIILDYEMPDMDGAQVLRRLKELGITKAAIGLTRRGEPTLSSMEESCALKAFCKDNEDNFFEFLIDRINDLGTETQ